jgi:hypothetical protein
MEWLERFKKVLEACPDIRDEQLFAVFPELENSADRLNAALLFPYHNEVAEEFKPKTSWWKQWLKQIR